MLQVAAYCRVSTDKEDQANSFEAQQRYFRDYIERQPDWVLQGIYADEGISGTSTRKRVEFNKMLHAAELGQIDLIVTKEVSRFTRNTVDALQITRDLRRRGVGVLFLNDSLDTRTNDGELRLTIMSSVAQDESRKTSERSKWGQTRSMEKGVVFGGSLRKLSGSSFISTCKSAKGAAPSHGNCERLGFSAARATAFGRRLP